MLPDAHGERERVLLLLDAHGVRATAQHVLVEERRRLRAPALLERERRALPLAAPELERGEPETDRAPDRVPVDQVAGAQRTVRAQRGRPGIHHRRAVADDRERTDRAAVLPHDAEIRVVAVRLEPAAEVVAALERRAEIAHVLEHHAMPGLELRAPPAGLESALLRLAHLVAQLVVEPLPLHVGVRGEREDERAVLLAGLEAVPALALVAQLEPLEGARVRA